MANKRGQPVGTHRGNRQRFPYEPRVISGKLRVNETTASTFRFGEGLSVREDRLPLRRASASVMASNHAEYGTRPYPREGFRSLLDDGRGGHILGGSKSGFVGARTSTCPAQGPSWRGQAS
jgi:hypothetical protein